MSAFVVDIDCKDGDGRVALRCLASCRRGGCPSATTIRPSISGHQKTIIKIDGRDHRFIADLLIDVMSAYVWGPFAASRYHMYVYGKRLACYRSSRRTDLWGPALAVRCGTPRENHRQTQLSSISRITSSTRQPSHVRQCVFVCVCVFVHHYVRRDGDGSKASKVNT